ncbi:MAG: hypothetical protein EHM61_25150 [Acidobacteria bacterium]|nr:MAG: hypothetical protein EHM61_25150 [Acidobacteriota bacterium]
MLYASIEVSDWAANFEAMTTTRKPPGTITLTKTEQQLLTRINFRPDSHEEYREVCRAASQLAKSLLKRAAIPEIRLAYFTKPEYNIGSRKSRLEVFESNGTEGDDVLGHPHFLKYLNNARLSSERAPFPGRFPEVGRFVETID